MPRNKKASSEPFALFAPLRDNQVQCDITEFKGRGSIAVATNIATSGDNTVRLGIDGKVAVISLSEAERLARTIRSAVKLAKKNKLEAKEISASQG